MAEAPPLAYFDTSALVKRFVGESGTLHVRRLLRRHRVISSVLLQVEIVAALRRRRTDGVLSQAAVDRILRRVRSDSSAWELVPIADEVIELARGCVLEHPVRTLDAIHVASAESVRREGLRLPFVTADTRQAATARARGLDVIEVRSDASRPSA